MLNQRIGLPSDLRFLELSEEEREIVAEQSMGNSMAGNPIPMTPEKVYEFLCSLS